jgi:hypothetical protein
MSIGSTAVLGLRQQPTAARPASGPVEVHAWVPEFGSAHGPQRQPPRGRELFGRAARIAVHDPPPPSCEEQQDDDHLLLTGLGEDDAWSRRLHETLDRWLRYPAGGASARRRGPLTQARDAISARPIPTGGFPCDHTK